MNDPDQFPEIIQFMQQAAPFPGLPDEALRRCVSQFSIHYLKAGDHSDRLQDPAIYWLRTGIAKITDKHLRLYDQLEESGCFGLALAGLPDDAKLTIVEDALVYRLSQQDAQTLATEHRVFKQFIQQSSSRYLRHANNPIQEQVLNLSLRQFIRREPVTISPDASAQQAAHLMSQLHVSCLPVQQNGHLLGIITDRDLRARLVAKGLPADTQVKQVMSTPVDTVDAKQQVMDALLLMSVKRVHHLPIIDGKQLVGIITSTDLMQLQQQSPIFIAGEIARQTELAGLISCCKRMPEFLIQLMAANVQPERIGAVLSGIYDSVTQRLLALAEARFGPPPQAYCWVVFGSHARQELHLASDQDNALLLAQDPSASDSAYFDEMCRWVCDALNACGLVTCPGKIMASNPEMRGSVKQWQSKFEKWLQQPTPQALLKSNIFFDLRPLFGEMGLADILSQQIAKQTQNNQMFLAMLAQVAAANSPPLGLFGQLKTEKDPLRGACVDLKKAGLSLLTDVARLYALASGTPAVQTLERLEAAVDQGKLSSQDKDELTLCYQRLLTFRQQQQQTDLQHQRSSGNLLAVDQLTPFDKHQLKDIFAVLDRCQQAILLKFAGGRG
ncbi:DUF294 nucleotidyltransferase-like domain-containing protein [Corallincola spongiicola]|uniref:CBS domain-containing protein n=1 Tax=Corallincola spongiicola TaxID=2520508 RepID=A0ABY1WM05_9GAMM|nr:DUF294 nucleotidyltransferase-like domain-containing protein [Corallincola spongiicola]TAA42619.1 CBS domain-containing protein [Corallincola spongiicola]